MPTPFTHLHITRRLAQDTQIDASVRQQLRAYEADFLLGGVIADAKPSADAPRSATHFYEYTAPMPDNPWREMFRQHPDLVPPQSDAHAVFLAGYVAHLAADEYWSRYMLKPHFANGDWGADIKDRFYVLHLLLIHMDERDEADLSPTAADTMRRSQPQDWLPFMDDAVICEWRDFIAEQLQGESQTIAIFSKRIRAHAEQVRQQLHDTTYMQTRLWANITPQMLAELERDLYQFSRQQLLTYGREFGIWSR